MPALERAAAGIINSTFGCAGMRCMALPVCVVENNVADEFIGYMKKFAEQRVVGCSYDPKTELGPVVSAEHQAFVKSWIDKGVEEGADLILDGRRPGRAGLREGLLRRPDDLRQRDRGHDRRARRDLRPRTLHQARRMTSKRASPS